MSLLGDNPWECNHPKLHGVTMIFVLPSEERDFSWACGPHAEFSIQPMDRRKKKRGVPTSVQLCDACAAQRPSVVIAKKEAKQRRAADDAKERAERLAFLKRVYTSSEDIFICDSCDDEVDPVVVRYCTFCESTFDGSNGSACPDCNRPFTRRSAENGCPACLEEETELEPRVLTAEEIAEVLAVWPDLRAAAK